MSDRASTAPCLAPALGRHVGEGAHDLALFQESNFPGGVYFVVGPENLYVLLTELKGNCWMVKVDRCSIPITTDFRGLPLNHSIWK